jgi:hypothetical protein
MGRDITFHVDNTDIDTIQPSASVNEHREYRGQFKVSASIQHDSKVK